MLIISSGYITQHCRKYISWLRPKVLVIITFPSRDSPLHSLKSIEAIKVCGITYSDNSPRTTKKHKNNLRQTSPVLTQIFKCIKENEDGAIFGPSAESWLPKYNDKICHHYKGPQTLVNWEGSFQANVKAVICSVFRPFLMIKSICVVFHATICIVPLISISYGRVECS